MIQFEVAGSKFRLITNQLELTTLRVITLYAYRWQIELFFKFIKRTLHGIHLLNHSENGVEIQFYLLMTMAVMMMKLKQDCQKSGLKADEKEKKGEKVEEKRAKKEESPPEWIKNVAKVFYESWKISKSWLTILKNSLSKVINYQLVTLLNSV